MTTTMITPKRINFPSWNLNIVGNLYIPPPDAVDRKNAAIVISHPMGGVKEQTPARYAEALTGKGFVTLTFDAAYQGESDGRPRGYENPYQRVEDIKAAVTFLTTLTEEVDAERIGVLGICASGGYVPNAAQGDVRMKAVATISGADMGRLTREGLKPKGSIESSQVRDALGASTGARTEEARMGDVQNIDLLPAESSGVPTGAPDLVKEGWEYYKTARGAHDRSNGIQPIRSTDLLVNYDSYAYNYLISPRPLLMIVGSEADTRYFSEDAVALAQEPKELFVVQNKTHVGLYDDLSETVPKLVQFYGSTLAV